MDGGPGWMLLMIAFIIAFCLIGLPAIVLGYLAQQGTHPDGLLIGAYVSSSGFSWD